MSHFKVLPTSLHYLTCVFLYCGTSFDKPRNSSMVLFNRQHNDQFHGASEQIWSDSVKVTCRSLFSCPASACVLQVGTSSVSFTHSSWKHPPGSRLLIKNENASFLYPRPIPSLGQIICFTRADRTNNRLSKSSYITSYIWWTQTITHSRVWGYFTDCCSLQSALALSPPNSSSPPPKNVQRKDRLNTHRYLGTGQGLTRQPDNHSWNPTLVPS